jgi:tripartite-type tricarboxylate transporter receptor subunit TctC
MLAGIQMVHVAYRGSPPALSDLMAGRIDVMFDNIASSMPFIQSGTLRPLAVSSRASALPDVPLISKFLPGYEAYVWNGIVAPKNCPPEIVAKLNAEIKEVVNDPAYKAQLTKVGNTAAFDTPDDFAKLIAADSAKWAKVITYAGIKPE